MSHEPITVTDASFDDVVLSSDKPVLVDFWAEWCPPCRALAPTLDELAGESDGRFVVAKLNVDENPRTTAGYNVSALPTIVLFRDGEPAERIVGVQPKEHYAAVATAVPA